ncbi:MAG TPA: hypothetical protein VIO94_06930 [Phenylobacterium sp.]
MIRFKPAHTFSALALLAAAAVPGAAFAEDDAIGALLTSAQAAAVEQGASEETVEAAELADISAGQDTHIEDSILSTQELNGTTSNNLIDGAYAAGDIHFDDNALQGFNGVGNFVVNTGAQNTLQGAITINILTVAP